MIVLEESPLYQEIFDRGFQLGFKIGFQLGFEIGFKQGLNQEIVPGIELILELKFGAEGFQLMPEIRAIEDPEKLIAIRDAAIAATSLAEVRQIYA